MALSWGGVCYKQGYLFYFLQNSKFSQTVVKLIKMRLLDFDYVDIVSGDRALTRIGIEGPPQQTKRTHKKSVLHFVKFIFL